MGDMADWVNDDTPEPDPVEEMHRNPNVKVMTSSEDLDWSTPQEFVDSLPFTFEIDVCATIDNAKCDLWISPSKDAMRTAWGERVCWMNPPYGRGVGDWIEKAYRESQKGAVVVCLVPNRTETRWFDRIWKDASLICFLGRRLKFSRPDKKSDTAPFANVIAVFGKLPANYTGADEYYAQEMSKFGTVMLPGYGNIWLHKESK